MRSDDLHQIEQAFSARALAARRFSRYRAMVWLITVDVADLVKRFIDFGVSGALLTLLAPVLLILHALNRAKGGKLIRSSKIGRWGCTFHQYSFQKGRFASLPALLNVWRGDMSFIGPRAISPAEASPSDRLAWRRFNTRPGLVGLWWIRVRANMAYGTEAISNSEYVETRSLLGDVGIALRAVPASMYASEVVLAPALVDLIGIPINNLTMDEAVETILNKCRAAVPSQVCFVNADCANIAWRDKEYADILRTCGLVLADGIGVRLAGKLLNRNIRQNVNGTDMLPDLCAALEKSGLGIFLLGGKPNVAEDVAVWMRKSYPELRIAGHQHGFFHRSELPDILETIKRSGADILLVAFGVPTQERWIRDHLEEAGVKVSVGVGGLFDFYSGRVPRAPVWMREVGMEWFYRFWQEPRRMWHRYFVGNALFLARVLRNRPRSPVTL